MSPARTIRPAVEPKTEKDTVPFTPYATIKDAFGISCFLLLYAWFISTCRTIRRLQLHRRHPGVTPAHIVRVVLFAVLRDPASIPNKLAGVTAMFSAIPGAGVPALARHRENEVVQISPAGQQFFWVFVIVCVLLGYLGAQPPEGIYVIVGRILTFCYFAYFLILLPLLSRIEKRGRFRIRSPTTCWRKPAAG